MSITQPYTDFLKSKIKLATSSGFEVDRNVLPDTLLPHAKDIVSWACIKGCALVAASFGLTKTRINIAVLKEIKKLHPSSPVLVICPLGVKLQFQEYDGPVMGVDFQYVRNREEQYAATSDFHITNYERVRDGDMDLSMYIAVALDEGSCLRSLGSDTTQTFIQRFRSTRYKFVYTATPSPNDFIELLNYAEYLGVMDRGQALTRFFQRDSQKAGNLTIHPDHEEAFWLWVSSWAIIITKPSDLGYSDDGYVLPELKVNYHLVKSDQTKIGNLKNREGQYKAFADSSSSLPEAAKVLRGTIDERLSKAIEIMDEHPKDHFLLWHLLEDERRAIELELPDAVTVFGQQDIDTKEKRLIDFTNGNTRILATKAEIAGSGHNFQHHCHRAIFMSVNDMFNDFIQAVHRIYRFMSPFDEITIDIIYTVEQQAIVDRSIKKKWQQHIKLQDKMREIIQRYGLHHSETIDKLTRSFGCERKEVKGKDFVAVNNDTVLELDDRKRWPDNSVGLIHTSIPFGNHYEYSSSYNDLGHNESNEIFWQQMDFAIPNWFRVLEPGRNAVIHVKDRIRYNTMTGLGSYTIDPFSDECTTAMKKHGFLFIGRITIVTDVVRENNQTYRLGWTEKCKDASKMGCGLPEYLLLFRKPQSDLSVGFADRPVKLDKQVFTLPKWQHIASSFWKSSGNRMIQPADLATWNADKVYKWIRAWSLNEVYDWDFHQEVGELLSAKDKLSKTFSSIGVDSPNENVWTGITHMHGLNARQQANKAEKHICPLPFDIVDRVIDSWSMPGDVVLDPFAGLFTVPYIAIKKGRKGIGVELNQKYFTDGLHYLRTEEMKQTIPTLFDVIKEEEKIEVA